MLDGAAVYVFFLIAGWNKMYDSNTFETLSGVLHVKQIHVEPKHFRYTRYMICSRETIDSAVVIVGCFFRNV